MENGIMLVRRQTVEHIFYEGDKYMRESAFNWYVYVNFSWESLPYIDCLPLESKYEEYAKSRNFQ